MDSLVNLTRYAAGQGFIDDTLHMAHNRYYFFRGRSDTVYLEGAMNATLKYFSAFTPPENIRNEIDKPWRPFGCVFLCTDLEPQMYHHRLKPKTCTERGPRG